MYDYTHVNTEHFDRGVTLELHFDPDPSSPREWDNLGTMVCWHRRADLGDRTIDTTDYEDYDHMIVSVTESADPIVIPLWLYEHGGMSMAAGTARPGYPFDCPWDSGQVGFIYCTSETVVREYGADTPENRQRAIDCMIGEVRTYDTYLQGMIYGYVVNGADGVGDSCWGYYDEDDALSEGRAAAEWAVRELESREGAAFMDSLLTMFGAPAA